MCQIKKGITLVELIVSAMLTALVILSVWNIELAGRRFFQSSQKELELLNTLSFVMEHIQKNAYNGSGYIDDPGVWRREQRIRIRYVVDTDWNFSNDPWVGYRFRDNKYEMWYYPNWTAWTNNPDDYEIIGNNIVNISFNLVEDNRVEISLGACYDPHQTLSVCGSRDNPTVALNSSVTLRSMSIH